MLGPGRDAIPAIELRPFWLKFREISRRKPWKNSYYIDLKGVFELLSSNTFAKISREEWGKGDYCEGEWWDRESVRKMPVSALRTTLEGRTDKTPTATYFTHLFLWKYDSRGTNNLSFHSTGTHRTHRDQRNRQTRAKMDENGAKSD